MDHTPEPALRIGTKTSAALGAFALLYLGLMLTRIGLTPDGFMVNFRMYYWTAMAHAQGANPYDPVAVAPVADMGFMHPFLYPPLWLPFFRAFTWLPYPAAVALFVALKTAALAGLFVLWTHVFLRRRFDGLFLFLCLIGFNYALPFDLESGNMSLFAVLGLWLAFWCYRDGKWSAFLALLLLSASLKLTPLFFLILLLPHWRSVPWPRLVLTGLPFLLLVAVAIALDPAQWHEYLGSLTRVPGVPTENVQTTPSNFVSSLGAIQGTLSALDTRTGLALPAILPRLIYMAFALTVLTFCAWYVVKRRPTDETHWREELVILATLAYILLLPRTNLYGYVLVLPSAYLVLTRMASFDARFVAVVVLAIPPIAVRPFGFDFLIDNLAAYYPLLLTAAFFLLALRRSDASSIGSSASVKDVAK